ncbi:MAG TPA: transposase [Anaerolineales bacterium]|nr:transposase [Anaerolineales bacterium]
MARPLRVQFEDAIYHLCARGNARERIFRGEKDQAQFLKLLEESAERFGVSIFCFVLMGNHFHLIAQTHRANLTRWMHWLSVAYSVYFNRRHRRSGHLFQGRYKSFLVQGNEGYLLTLSRYVHLNPVRGISLGRGTPSERRERLRAFKWSSYRGYAGLGRQFSFVREGAVMGSLAGGLGAQRQRLEYRRYVEEGLLREIENPFELVKWQAVLGDECFVQKVRDGVSKMGRGSREIKSVRRMDPAMSWEQVLQGVAKKYKVQMKQLVEGEHGLGARNVAMWMLWEGGGRTLREIGELFGGIDYAAVAQRIRRARQAHNEKSALRLRQEILNI